MKVRTTKTRSGSTAVQVVEYINYKRKILAHIGSGKTEEEISSLKVMANEWISQNNRQLSLFPKYSDISNDKSSKILSVDKCVYLGFRYNLFYEVMYNLSKEFKFHLLGENINKILIDLVIVRLIEPTSKVRSLKFLSDYFGIEHSRRDLYRKLEDISNLKDEVESKIVSFARDRLNFDFSMVFYDLTTLYFESFTSDDLRKIGFSKDNKTNQPQIMIGLLVNKDGFPISHQVFEGNKFEGHTMIPIIKDLMNLHNINKEDITIVADSAMISAENIDYLLSEELNFIVGARIANLNEELINEISNNLKRMDNNTYRVNNQKKKNCHLITHFSDSRYRKDKHEMNKQLNKAHNLLNTSDPAQVRKRSKFLSKANKDKNCNQYKINNKLVNKTEKLLGIKGYYTNHKKMNNYEVIDKYYNLWQVEKSFRISKSDLSVRPIYHFKEHAIKAHILICFMALAMAKYIEIKTGKSIKSNIDKLKSITDARILNKNNNQEVLMRKEVNHDINNIIKLITH